jgi:hypothetical protein
MLGAVGSQQVTDKQQQIQGVTQGHNQQRQWAHTTLCQHTVIFQLLVQAALSSMLY